MTEDGAVVTYCKDGVLYPVGITKEQNQMIQIIIRGFVNPLPVLLDHPIGEAVNYAEVKQ